MAEHTISLRTKITASFVLITTIALIVTSMINYISGKKLLENASFNSINAIRNIKAGQLEQYIDLLISECLSTSENTMLFDAIEQFQEAFSALHASPEEFAGYKSSLEKFYTDEFLPKLNQTAQVPYTLHDFFPTDERTIIAQTWYLAQNPQPLQKKGEYSRAANPDTYNTLHEKYHYIFKRYAKRLGISDMYLVDLNTGYIIYSLNKEIDFGTNIWTGPFKDTGLGQSLRDMQKTSDEDFCKIIDFQFYIPSYGTPVGFINSPIYRHGKKLGGLIFKFPLDKINEIMTYNKQWMEAGLGKTGESFIMGNDKLMRSVAREYVEDPTKYISALREHGYDANILDKIQIYDTTVLLKKVNIEAVQEAIEGKTNTVIAKDTLNRKVILTYAPMKIADIQWNIVVKIDVQEAFAPVNSLLWYIFLLVILIVTITTICSFMAVYVFTKPFSRIIQLLKNPSLALSQKLSVEDSTEFATIAHAYNALTEHISSMLKRVRSIQEQMGNSNNDLVQHIKIIQKAAEEANTCNQRSQNIGETIIHMNHTVNTADDHTEALMTQWITTVNLIHATVAQTGTQVETFSNDLNLLDEEIKKMNSTASDTEKRSVLNEIKNKMQHMLNKVQVAVQSFMSMQNSYEQIKTLITETQQQQNQKNSSLESVTTHTQQFAKSVEDIKIVLNKIATEAQELQTIQTQYEDLARQLTLLTEQIDI